MDTNRIRYFLSLSRTGSITQAAEVHHISAAAFSKAMKIFEAEVGETLTIPHGRGLVLTDYAKSLVPSLQAIIQQIDAIRDRTTRKREASKLLRIATFEVFSTHFMVKTIRDFFPEFGCEIYEMIPGKMEEAVASGKADLALTYLPIPHPDLDLMRIVDIEMAVFGHPSLIGRSKYDTIPFAAPVTPIEGSPDKVRGLDGWPDDAYPRVIKYHVEMLETALGLCRDGLAAAYIPKFTARLHNELIHPDLRIVSMGLPQRFPKRKDSVYLIKRKSDHEGFAAKKLAQAVRKICG